MLTFAAATRHLVVDPNNIINCCPSEWASDARWGLICRLVNEQEKGKQAWSVEELDGWIRAEHDLHDPNAAMAEY